MSKTSSWTHKNVATPAGRTHLVEQGSGPLVLLVHGFPESWYSWRHTIPALAEAGYRAVAYDVRGYGRSSKPVDTSAYGMVDLVEDAAAVVKALGEPEAIIIGHDWGSGIATTAALLKPEIFKAVAQMSVPYLPPSPAEAPKPTEMYAQMGGPEEHYMSYFQEIGRAEAEIEPDIRGWLRGFYAALSADTQPGPNQPPAVLVPKGAQLKDRFPTATPAWLTDEVMDVYAAEFERTGVVGALNRYRCLDKDAVDLVGHAGQPLMQPALFIGGAADGLVLQFMDYINNVLPQVVPNLFATHLIDGAGHWLQNEAPQDVNKYLLEWLGTLKA